MISCLRTPARFLLVVLAEAEIDKSTFSESKTHSQERHTMFTTANQVAASEQLLTEAANAVSFADPLTTAYTIVAVIVVLLWATGVLAFGRVEAQDRGVIPATGRKRRDRATHASRSSLIGRQTPAA